MPVRSLADARVADAIRAAMKNRALSRDAVADAIEKITGTRPNAMWLSRNLGGGAHLTEMEPTTKPNETLRLIAQAIDPENADQLADELASHAAERIAE